MTKHVATDVELANTQLHIRFYNGRLRVQRGRAQGRDLLLLGPGTKPSVSLEARRQSVR